MLASGMPIAQARRENAAAESAVLPKPELPGLLWATLTRDQSAVFRDMVDVAMHRVVEGQSASFLYSRSYCCARIGLTERRARVAITALLDASLVRRSEGLSGTTHAYVLGDDAGSKMYELLTRGTSRRTSLNEYRDTRDETHKTPITRTSPREPTVETGQAPVTPVGPEELSIAGHGLPLHRKRCAVCSDEFEYRRSTARYCSAACKARAHRSRARESSSESMESIGSDSVVVTGSKPELRRVR
jgi:hypothetical protein